MRFLPTRIHGVIDYLWGLALIAAPFVLGFADGGAAQWTALVAGAGALVYAAVTDFELGIWRLLPMPAHLVIDGLGGAALAASPFLFGFADQVRWPHVLFGLFAVVASLITETRARG
ncbi:MAG TPA: hypothetical protein VIL65_09630 [Beijerinckiaceae bacterium]|jgi:hypothetical protein